MNIDNLAIEAIRVYQNYISPYKGFICAHRVLHGGVSCSEFVKIAIVEEGCLKAIPLAQARFEECKAANLRLKNNFKTDRRSKKKNCNPPAELCSILFRGCAENAGEMACNGCEGADCGSDFNGCEGADCSSDCDIGNCG